ncbi:MAG: YkgJ family cysteine cluster protein [Nitrospirae bacterium]|nr:MAG: YkgJ family cysteine cluster protein [Nitrospirota bacterium]
MAQNQPVERFEVSLNTPAGQCTSPLNVPTGLVPVTALVPSLRRLGEQAQALEERRTVDAGAAISCRKGCAACCRMLVPISAPEAFALRDSIQALPESRRATILQRVTEARTRLEQAGLLARLIDLAETERQLLDDEFEATNRDYYALRLPCPFLENEACSIYEDRPAACRELLVTTPAELCQDLARNPVRPLPVAVRMSTALALWWSELVGGPARLIPLPLALEWADRHAAEGNRTWPGPQLLDKALDKVWRLLSEAFAHQPGTPTGKLPQGPT